MYKWYIVLCFLFYLEGWWWSHGGRTRGKLLMLVGCKCVVLASYLGPDFSFIAGSWWGWCRYTRTWWRINGSRRELNLLPKVAHHLQCLLAAVLLIFFVILWGINLVKIIPCCVLCSLMSFLNNIVTRVSPLPVSGNVVGLSCVFKVTSCDKQSWELVL